jgi:hypothetical protein
MILEVHDGAVLFTERARSSTNSSTSTTASSDGVPATGIGLEAESETDELVEELANLSTGCQIDDYPSQEATFSVETTPQGLRCTEQVGQISSSAGIGKDGALAEETPTSQATVDKRRREARLPVETSGNKAEHALLVAALARVLTQLASLGQVRSQTRSPLPTGFHAVRAPQLSLHAYLDRIATYFLCSDECLVLSLVYIDRIMKLHPEFIVNTLSIHRLLATSITVAAKFFDDDFFANSYYSRVAGVKVQELNALEAKFLYLIEWRLHVPPEEFDQYKGHVLQAVQGTSFAPADCPQH